MPLLQQSESHGISPLSQVQKPYPKPMEVLHLRTAAGDHLSSLLPADFFRRLLPKVRPASADHLPQMQDTPTAFGRQLYEM